MTSRNPAEAVSEYVSSIQRVVSCVSNSIVSVDGGYYVSDAPHILRLNQGRTVRMGGTSRIRLAFYQYYRVVETEVPRIQWMVVEEGYEYRILDSDGREIIVYHWHPVEHNPIAFHHLHIEHGAQVGREELQTAHLPTGYVSVADILRLLIVDFRVPSRRDDWESVLDTFQ